MMRKTYSIIAGLALVSSIGALAVPQTAEAKYGRAGAITTPKAIRGSWYHRGWKDIGQKPGRIYCLRFSAHKANGRAIYRVNGKYYDKFNDGSWSKHKSWILRQTDKWQWGSLQSIKGQRVLNINAWLSGAGDGTYFIPARRHGQKALRVATGAGPYTAFYAYRSKKLAAKY